MSKGRPWQCSLAEAQEGGRSSQSGKDSCLSLPGQDAALSGRFHRMRRVEGRLCGGLNRSWDKAAAK
jgi:hypothetical protein